jgi:hypothetical protein
MNPPPWALYSTRSNQSPCLLKPGRVPAVNVPVERDDCNLLSLVVVAQRPNSVGRLTRLLHERLAKHVRGDVSARHLLYHLLGDAPEGHGAVAGAGHDKLVVDPRHVEDPVRVSALKKEI